MKKILYIFLLFLPSLVFAQEADVEKTYLPGEGWGETLLDSLYADFIGLEVREDFDSAYVILKKCYEIDPEVAELNYQMALYQRMYAEEDTTRTEREIMEDLIVKLRKAYDLEPDNKKYVQTLLNACAQVGDTIMVQPLLEKIVELDKDNEQYITILMRLYDSKGEYEKELKLLDHLETLTGWNPQIDMARAEMYKDYYGEKKALKYVQGLIKKSPNQSIYHLYLAQYYSEKENFKKALPYYDKALALDPSDGATRYSYIECLGKMGKDAEARQMRLDIVNDPKSASELKKQVIRDLLEEFETEENGTEKMMQMFRTALEQPQENSDLMSLYVQYMAIQNYSADSIAKAVENILVKEPTNEEAYMTLLGYYGEQDDKEKVIDVCSRAIANGVDKLEIYFYQAAYNYQMDRQDEALRLLEKAVANRKFANNPKMYADCYEMIGDIYHSMDSLQRAFDSYEECLRWNPDNYGALNNYAYFLAIEDKELEKAERMSKKTVLAEPNNGTYLDTYAWVLFKLGRYQEAAVYINRTISQTGGVSEVEYEHAGDIYYMLNEKDAAMAYWELAQMRAAAAGKDTTDLDRKIRTKKL